ncbi:hypothetical protein [Roseiconus nitratireducens]|nr:hypothetical protein [Roseiconus nitratireducens]
MESLRFRFARLRIALSIIALLIWFAVGAGAQNAETPASGELTGNRSTKAIPDEQAASEMDASIPAPLRRDDFGASEIASANTFVESLHLADWLGPLAPIALSPFFGLTVLSGLALWGPAWVTDNALLSNAGPLHHESVFVVFLILTVLTSIPRLSKVSKPFAQAMDQVEAYSVIIILLVIKILASVDAEPAPVAVVQLGVLSFTAQTLLMIAMVINLIVINSVKFFFEVLIWLTPVPAIDALFEIGNKTICAALLALYAMSPTIATLVNLGILFAALLVFRWVSRRLTFYRTMFFDPLLSMVWKSYGRPHAASLVAFPKASRDPFVAKSRWRLAKDQERWVASPWGLLGGQDYPLDVVSTPEIRRGWIAHTLWMETAEYGPLEFHVSRRYDGALQRWMELCEFRMCEAEESQSRDVTQARTEFG